MAVTGRAGRTSEITMVVASTKKGLHHPQLVSSPTAGHSYHVKAAFAEANGQRWVILQNPWGKDGGTVTDSKPNDGQVKVTWEDFIASMGHYATTK